jgi:hypothetical protein
MSQISTMQPLLPTWQQLLTRPVSAKRQRQRARRAVAAAPLLVPQTTNSFAASTTALRDLNPAATFPVTFTNMSVTELMQLMVRLRPTDMPQASPALPPLVNMQRQVISTMHNNWASSTWAKTRNLVQRLAAFRLQHNLQQHEQTDWAINMFISSEPGLTPATRLAYLKTLAAFFRKMKCDLPLCSIMASTLTASGALIPTQQAQPATIAEMNRVLAAAAKRHGPRLMTLYFIMTKTASRFDEVARLTKQQMVEYSRITPSADNNWCTHELIISWADRTKSTRRDPFRASSWTVIHHHQPMDLIVATLQSLQEEEQLLQWDSSDSLAFIRSVVPELSNHSFKRGVLSYLLSLDPPVPLDVLPVLAKHKHQLQFPSVTIRYAAGPNMARSLRTQLLTSRIPAVLPLDDGATTPTFSAQQQPTALPISMIVNSNEMIAALCASSSDSSEPEDDVPLVQRFPMASPAAAQPAAQLPTAPASAHRPAKRPADQPRAQSVDSGVAAARRQVQRAQRQQQEELQGVTVAEMPGATIRQRVRNLRRRQAAAGAPRDNLYNRFSIL